ncbi:hypothetical protein RUM43_000101 [Polyplax serrata]|uniref:Tudor domain-containing protein n=1 Tax=Polyplax serrata TaxID=468196 RepID=A0AAN8XMK8_POLSC
MAVDLWGLKEVEDASDIWDDTLLIEAYEKAAKSVRDGCLQGEPNTVGGAKKGRKKGSLHQWKVGDKCKCRYSNDLKYYEADIIELNSASGICTVKYVGYENEESTSVTNLRQSSGENARLKQTIDAANENDVTSEVSNKTKLMNNMNGHNKSPNWTCLEPPALGSFAGHQGLNNIVPPPPPPSLFRNVCEDDAETEAMSAMLISWYMSGYHTGYYQGLKMARKKSRKS